jgi:hypothetical protein
MMVAEDMRLACPEAATMTCYELVDSTVRNLCMLWEEMKARTPKGCMLLPDGSLKIKTIKGEK